MREFESLKHENFAQLLKLSFLVKNVIYIRKFAVCSRAQWRWNEQKFEQNQSGFFVSYEFVCKFYYQFLLRLLKNCLEHFSLKWYNSDFNWHCTAL